MDKDYLIWALKRSSFITLAYFFASLLLWVFTGGEDPWFAGGSTIGMWVLLFTVYCNDPRTRRLYEKQIPPVR